MSRVAETELGRHWKTVLASMVGVGFGASGLPFYSMGLFIKPLSAAFGWNRAQISVAGLCLQFGMVFAAPVVGFLVDRFGARRVALISMLCLTLGLASLSGLKGDLMTLYVIWSALAVMAGGTTPVVWTRAINRCFNRQRGVALGLTLAGTGVAAIGAPILLGPVIAGHGWRAGYLALAAVTALVALPMVAIFLRDAKPAASEDVAPLEGAALKEALGAFWFWRCGLGFMIIAGGVAALILHLAPMLMDSGLSPQQAGGVAGMLGITIIVGRLCVGALVDRFPAAYVGMSFLILPAIACLLLTHGAPIPAALLIGLAAGAEVDLLAYLVSRRFGMRNYGQIYGCQHALFSIGAGIGPVLLGAAHDRMGSYMGALNVDAVMILAGALVIGSLRRGGPRLAQSPA
jgi:MFS family permease